MTSQGITPNMEYLPTIWGIPKQVYPVFLSQLAKKPIEWTGVTGVTLIDPSLTLP